MSQSQHELDVFEVDVAPESGDSGSLYQPVERPRSKRLIKLSACLGALSLGLGSPAVSAEPLFTNGHQGSTSPQRLEIAGYNTNKIWVTSLDDAEEEGQLIAASRADAVRIIAPYTQGGININNDVERTCNAAKAANDNHLQLIITMAGYYRNGELGFMPTTDSQKRRYVTTIGNMLWWLAGDENGCVPSQKNITIGLMNEPDNPLYNRNQVVNGQWVAPKDEVGLLAYAYPRLKAIASSPGLDVNLTIIGGELSSPSPSRNTVGFIRKMGQIIKGRRINTPIMDAFALHQYANSFSTSPLAPNNSFSTNTLEAIKTYIDPLLPGPDLPVIYDELGAFSSTPSAQENQYRTRQPASIVPFKGVAQGDFYNRFIKDATCSGVKGVMILHYDDDPGDKLRTGVAFPDKQLKPSAHIVTPTFENALDGNLDCP